MTRHIFARPVSLLLLSLLTAAYAPAQSPTLHVTEAEAKRAAVTRPAPAYSATARQLKIAGKVEIEAVVNTDGTVDSVRVVAGNPILSSSVVEAVKKWRFNPFNEQGKPARAAVSLSFEFARL